MKSENLPTQVAPSAAPRKTRAFLAVGLPTVLLLGGLAYQSTMTRPTASAVAAPAAPQTVQLHARSAKTASVSPGYQPSSHPLVSVKNVAPAPEPATSQGMIAVGPDGKVPSSRRATSATGLNSPITAGTTSAGGEMAVLNPGYHPLAVAHKGPDGKPCISCIEKPKVNSSQKTSARGHAGHTH